MEVKVLTTADLNRLLRIANVMGRTVHEEVNESIPNIVEATVCKIMVAELMLINVMRQYAERDPQNGLRSFNDMHAAIQQAIMNSNVIQGG